MKKPVPILNVSLHHLFFVFPFSHKDGKNKGDLNFTEKKTFETILSLTIQIHKKHHPE